MWLTLGASFAVSWLCITSDGAAAQDAATLFDEYYLKIVAEPAVTGKKPDLRGFVRTGRDDYDLPDSSFALSYFEPSEDAFAASAFGSYTIEDGDVWTEEEMPFGGWRITDESEVADIIKRFESWISEHPNLNDAQPCAGEKPTDDATSALYRRAVSFVTSDKSVGIVSLSIDKRISYYLEPERGHTIYVHAWTFSGPSAACLTGY
ncbi:hypothetical protein OEZ71_14015 [Defluviimonas sp. WL0050]|uniref:Uncharacterized protein n=1 Tax=Albidovulum litorale TaxID=2984134 RepID=A0ABT2ZQH4_9RHOB|nr:hypothetical protein [Defluviimonas sp. WL0050]MCV2873411.1 hypothetical protein [Defluviimonas sp. WL0050]